MSIQGVSERPAFRSKSDVLVDLERRILGGELAVGQKLPSERDLGLHYSVSRPVIRETLAGLVERGYIEILPGRGSFVRAVASDVLSQPLTRVATRAGLTPRHMVAARVMLECAAAEAAAQNATESDIEKIFDALHAHSAATELSDRAHTDLAFHESVAAASGNPAITLLFGAIRNQVHALMLRSLSDRKVRRVGDPMHQRIATAIGAHDAQEARTAMAAHIELALTLYGKDLDRPLAEVMASRGLMSGAPLRTLEE